MNKESKNRKLFGILCLAVSLVAVTFAYASFTHTLRIKAMNECDINSDGDKCISGTGYPTYWSIVFENLSKAIKTGSTIENVAPTITAPTRIGDYRVTFYTPGDSVTYMFDVVNKGKLDAMLSGTYMVNPICIGDNKDCSNVLKNIKYTLTYEDGTLPKYGDVLYAKSNKGGKTYKKRMKLTLKYADQIPSNELPKKEVMIDNLEAIMFYVQKNVIYDK